MLDLARRIGEHQTKQMQRVAGEAADASGNIVSAGGGSALGHGYCNRACITQGSFMAKGPHRIAKGPQRPTSWATIVAIMSFMGAQVASAQQLETESLGTGPYAEMVANIEKTFLDIEVVTVRVRFDQSKAAEFRSILQAPAPDEIYEAQIMRAARRADNVLVAVRFSRDVPLGQFLKQSRDDLAEALRAELITPDTYRRAVAEMQKTFAPLSERGFEKGDTLYYRVRPDSVRRLLTSDENRTLMDRTTPGVDIRQAMLAGHFTPASKLALDLVESLIELSPSV